MDLSFNNYVIEFIANIILGVIFGNKIENAIGIIILVLITIAGVTVLNQELLNPTAIANNTTSLTNFVIFATNFLPSLAISGAGTTIGIAIGRKIKDR